MCYGCQRQEFLTTLSTTSLTVTKDHVDQKTGYNTIKHDLQDSN